MTCWMVVVYDLFSSCMEIVRLGRRRCFLLMWIILINYSFAEKITFLKTELPAPRNLIVDSIEENAFVLKWKSPLPARNRKTRLQGYMLSYAPTDPYAASDEANVVMIPAAVQSKLVTKLRENTEYSVVLTAVYPNIQQAAAPKLFIKTERSVGKLPSRDDALLQQPFDCDCEEKGTLACIRGVARNIECVCNMGYCGIFCHLCDRNYFRVNGSCQPCPCNQTMSNGECYMDEENLVHCSKCVEGYQGRLCNSCQPGYVMSLGVCLPLCHDCYNDEYEEPISIGCPKYHTDDADYIPWFARTYGDIIFFTVVISFIIASIIVISYRLLRRCRKAKTFQKLKIAPFWKIDQSVVVDTKPTKPKIKMSFYGTEQEPKLLDNFIFVNNDNFSRLCRSAEMTLVPSNNKTTISISDDPMSQLL